MKFQTGDIVEAWGVDGVVRSIGCFIHVKFSTRDTANFYLDGKLEEWHAEPTLKFVSRPKRKVKKTIWVNIYEGKIYRVFDSESDAVASANFHARLCAKAVPFVGEVEE